MNLTQEFRRIVASTSCKRRIPIVFLSLLSLCFARPSAAQATIYVTTAAQGVTDPANCSLQEAIYSSEFKLNIAISATDPDTFYTTGCVPGTGNNDRIVLRPFDVLIFDHPWTDAHNYTGPTATPIIFSGITIEGNGSTLQWVGSGNSRLFAVGDVSINDPNNSASGVGDLVLENVNVVGFHVKGGDGGSGAGGGMGAGGVIYVASGYLTVLNCTFNHNGAVGGNGSGGSPSGGGGGLSGNGGNGNAEGGGGGGGGGARGNGGNGGGPLTGGGGGGGGTVESGGDGTATSTTTGVGGPGGYLCGGNGGDAGNDGSTGKCDGGGGGGGGYINFAYCSGFSCLGNGLTGAYGGGGGGGGDDDGGSGGFGGGGGGGSGGFVTSGGHGGFGGGGGGACCASIDTSPGGAGEFGGNASGSNGGGGGGLGGAIFSAGSTIILNSTFTNNYVVGGAGGDNGPNDGGKAAGGAIFGLNGSLTITNSTISGNQTSDIGGGVTYFVLGTCTGSCLTADATFTLNNTIIANNGYKECAVLGHSGAGEALIYTGAGNLITQNDSDGPCPGVVSTSDPGLQPLQLNSPGNTPTMAILANSPAIDAADSGTSLSVDQRGVTRPQMNGYDIGAYEARPADFSISAMPPIPVGVGESVSVTVTVNSFEYFSAPVTLSVPTPPAGVSVSFSTNPITPSADGSASTTMTITLAPTVTPGSYYIPEIQGDSPATITSAALEHSISSTVIVSATTSSISTVIHDFAAAGAINKPEIVPALNIELTIAQDCINFGHRLCAIFSLDAMILELKAESGRHITAPAAAVLITDTEALQSSLK